MKAIVSEKGLVIPKELLKGIKEVYIHKDNKKIVVVPVNIEDPIFKIGKNPVFLNITDASENHDKYIYGSAK